VSDDPGARERLFVGGIAELTARLGADHPETLNAGHLWGVSEPRLARALQIQEATCRKLDQHGALTSGRAKCWKEVGFLKRELEDASGAAEAMETGWNAASAEDRRAQGIYAGLEPYFLLWRGQLPEAARLFEATLDAMPELPGEAWWRTLRRAESEVGLGRARRMLGDLDGASRVLKSAVERLGPLVEKQPRADFELRLGRARIELSHVLAIRGKRRQAVDPAAPALAWLRRVGGSRMEIQKLTRLLAGP
jgi:hypothetical protein